MMDTHPLDQYKTGLESLNRQKLEAMEEERLDLLRRVRPAGDALKALGAREVFLFGSILSPYRFDGASDIDILVIGLPDTVLLKALGAVERATGILNREINLVFDQMAPGGLCQHGRETGLPL
jgi:predicted nucleotidyltransferase